MNKLRGAVLAAAVLSLVCASNASAMPSGAGPLPPLLTVASTASLIDDAPVYAHAGGTKAFTTARADTSWTGSQTVLLIVGSARDSVGRLWLRVMLPIRPNGSSGWILGTHAELGTTATRVEISLNARALILRSAGRVVLRTRVVIGKPSTPTPRGLFAIYERADSGPGANIGPFALHLTAFSDVLHSYDGGPGRIAIHGRAGSLLADPLGSAASHGCVRISNAALLRVAQYAKPGTPVQIAYDWPKPPPGPAP
ncbi:MAG: L,D-transpeptidase [Actinomycetes bacterium]|jgi:lipoprotein-anchoring transpeptidase ErfK/SrfK